MDAADTIRYIGIPVDRLAEAQERISEFLEKTRKEMESGQKIIPASIRVSI